MKMKFDLIGLFVSDLKTMVRFYHEVLGIDINWDGINGTFELAINVGEPEQVDRTFHRLAEAIADTVVRLRVDKLFL